MPQADLRSSDDLGLAVPEDPGACRRSCRPGARRGRFAGRRGPCDPPNANPVACENTKPGNPASEWDVSGAGSSSIQGFATDISVDQGQTVSFKIDTAAARLPHRHLPHGLLRRLGARKVATVQPLAALPQMQPNCLARASTGLIDCGNWARVGVVDACPPTRCRASTSPSWCARTAPAARATSSSSSATTTAQSDLLFQTSDTTWQAYNPTAATASTPARPAGRALQGQLQPAVHHARQRARRLGVQRRVPDGPVARAQRLRRQLHHRHRHRPPRRRAARAQGVPVRGPRRVLVGRAARQRRSRARRRRAPRVLQRQRGVLEDPLGAEHRRQGTPHRTLVTYKETHANAKIDPQPGVWTGTWRDPRFSPPADGGRPENALTGQHLQGQRRRHDARSRCRRPTASCGSGATRSVATLAAGATATLPNGTLGYEWDEDLDNGVAPAGSIRLSSTTVHRRAGAAGLRLDLRQRHGHATT